MCLHGSCLIFGISISHLQPLAPGPVFLLPRSLQRSSPCPTGDAPLRVAIGGGQRPRDLSPSRRQLDNFPTPTEAMVALPHPDGAAMVDPWITRRDPLARPPAAPPPPRDGGSSPIAGGRDPPRVRPDPAAPPLPRPLDLATTPFPSPTGGSGGQACPPGGGSDGSSPSRRQRRLPLHLPQCRRRPQHSHRHLQTIATTT